MTRSVITQKNLEKEDKNKAFKTWHLKNKSINYNKKSGHDGHRHLLSFKKYTKEN